MARNVAYRLWIEWNHNYRYSNESAYLISASGSMRLAAPESSIASGRGIVDECTILLDNSSGRYSPLNDGSPIFNDIQDGKAYHAPMYLEVSIDGGDTWPTIFTGVIKIPRETGATMRATASVTLDCRSRDETLLTKRISTRQVDFVRAHNEFCGI